MEICRKIQQHTMITSIGLILISIILIILYAVHTDFRFDNVVLGYKATAISLLSGVIIFITLRDILRITTYNNNILETLSPQSEDLQHSISTSNYQPSVQEDIDLNTANVFRTTNCVPSHAPRSSGFQTHVAGQKNVLPRQLSILIGNWSKFALACMGTDVWRYLVVSKDEGVKKMYVMNVSFVKLWSREHDIVSRALLTIIKVQSKWWYLMLGRECGRNPLLHTIPNMHVFHLEGHTRVLLYSLYVSARGWRFRWSSYLRPDKIEIVCEHY